MSATTGQPFDRGTPRAGGDDHAWESQLAAVVRLGQLALEEFDISHVLQQAVELLREVLDVEYAKVLHQPFPGEPLVLMAGSGWRNDTGAGRTKVPCGRDSQAGYTLLSNEPVIVENLATEHRFDAPQLLLDHHVVSGISVSIPGRERPYGVLGVHSHRRRRFTASEAGFVRSVANILGGAVDNQNIRQDIEQRVQYETALAECAQSLLASKGETRLHHALEALLTATQATYVFVERNVTDPDLGFCSQTVAEVEEEATPGYELDNEYWSLVPWERMPAARSHLEQGRPFVVIPEQLEGPEFELYAKDPFPVKCELDIPIFVDGEWVGLIGFADRTVVRRWSEADISLLTTAARMIGAFWERETVRNRLRQLNRAKDEFLASISHELRTPLTSVMGYAQLLRESNEQLTVVQRREAAEMVLKQATDLNAIVGDLLVAAKAEMGQLAVSRVPVNLQAQAAQILEEFGERQTASIQMDGPPVRALGDPARVRQILRNLITNARRYGGDRIRIETLQRDGLALAVVADNGAGIQPEDRQRIFQPHERAAAAPGLTAALGLGLSISRELALRMGGDLTYRYAHGESLFELSLPRSD